MDVSAELNQASAMEARAEAWQTANYAGPEADARTAVTCFLKLDSSATTLTAANGLPLNPNSTISLA